MANEIADEIQMPPTTARSRSLAPGSPAPAGPPGGPAPAASAEADRGGAESVGRYLSRQRRMRGISLEELSEITRIPVRSLERLEGGRFDGDADGFVRGFVRTVGEALGLDADDTVSRLLSEVHVDSDPGGSGVSLHRTAVAVLAVLALAALLGVGRWLLGGASAPHRDASPVVYRQDPVRALADTVVGQGGVPAPATPLPGAEPSSPPAPSLTAEAERP